MTAPPLSATLVSLLLAASEVLATVSPRPIVPWDTEMADARLTAGGTAVPIGEWNPPGKPALVRYAHFETDGPVEVRIAMKDGDNLAGSIASNDRKNIVAEQTGNGSHEWKFTMRPGNNVFLRSLRLWVCAGAIDPSAPRPGAAGVTDVATLGLRPDTGVPVTAALQKVIDTASAGATAAKPRTLYFPPGTYISGTLFMRDDVTLYLEAGAILRGAEDPSEWRFHPGPIDKGSSAFLFFGNDVEQDGTLKPARNAAIRGRGTIDGWGHFFRPEKVNGVPGNNPYYYEGDRTNKARLIMAMGAENCRIEGVTLRNPTFWTAHILGSKKFDFTGVRVHSNYRINGDGINYDGSSDSTIDGCVMITGDDSHCLKNEYLAGLGGPNDRITMRNTLTAGFPKRIKFGWAFHQARHVLYENNWLIGGSFGIELGVKPIRVDGPKISEVSDLTLRDMVIDGDFIVQMKGDKVDGFKLEKITVENTRIGGQLRIRNAVGVTLRGVTVGNQTLTTPSDVADRVTESTDVRVE
jgi:hypothetical protein